MKLFYLVLAVYGLILDGDQGKMDIREIRALYYEASTSEKAAREFYKKMEGVKGVTSVELGYKGMSRFMLCNYGLNPFTKLSYFKEGKKILEKALVQDAENTELHYLRFTIQTNVPSFLGYSNNVKEDRNFLLLSLPKVKDSDLFYKIVEYMLSSDYCTQDDKDTLMKIKNGRSNTSRF